ncbi:2-keto-4-pentenoate hydratase [Rothia halotolerans]|uniref:2-keto-4-pentenoate hydratase n=1 Tax=Rothia halotolerans TaxID=405770 RepID=UPI00101BDE66|nr:hypothetical protein [Rothia halotolerans]
MSIDVETVAQRLIDATEAKQPLQELFGKRPAMSVADSFRVQQEVVRRKVAGGDKVVGFKLGNIAKAMQNKFGVDQPDYGYLLASQFEPENLAISAQRYIQPYVELEPAFILKDDLGGPHTTVADVIRATDYVVPSLEIIDSRVKDWDIGIFDTLADSGSSGGVILGSRPRRLTEVNLADTPGHILVDGETVASGNTSAIYGSPISALVWLCRRVAEFGVEFRAGDVIIPGSCLEAVSLTPGTQVTGTFEGWGEVSFEYSR